MRPDYPPPSKAERKQLVSARNQDWPSPSPAPRPPGSIGAVIDASINRQKADRAHERERRIFTIDQALSAREGQAKSGLSAVKDKGLAKAQATKARTAKTRELTR